MDWYTSHQFAPRKLALSWPSIFVSNNYQLHHSDSRGERRSDSYAFLALPCQVWPSSAAMFYPLVSYRAFSEGFGGRGHLVPSPMGLPRQPVRLLWSVMLRLSWTSLICLDRWCSFQYVRSFNAFSKVQIKTEKTGTLAHAGRKINASAVFFLLSQPIVVSNPDRKLEFTAYWVLCTFSNLLRSCLFFHFTLGERSTGTGCPRRWNHSFAKLNGTLSNPFGSCRFPAKLSEGLFVSESFGMTCNTSNLSFIPQCNSSNSEG